MKHNPEWQRLQAIDEDIKAAFRDEFREFAAALMLLREFITCLACLAFPSFTFLAFAWSGGSLSLPLIVFALLGTCAGTIRMRRVELMEKFLGSWRLSNSSHRFYPTNLKRFGLQFYAIKQA